MKKKIDTRNRYIVEDETKIENPFWQEYLDKGNGQFVSGYDWSNLMITTFIFNMFKYKEDLEEVGFFIESKGEDATCNIGSLFDEGRIPSVQEIKDSGFSENEKKAAVLIRCLLEFEEDYRNDMISTLIALMNDKQYEKIKRKTMNEKYILRFRPNTKSE